MLIDENFTKGLGLQKENKELKKQMILSIISMWKTERQYVFLLR